MHGQNSGETDITEEQDRDELEITRDITGVRLT